MYSTYHCTVIQSGGPNNSYRHIKVSGHSKSDLKSKIKFIINTNSECHHAIQNISKTDAGFRSIDDIP